MIVFNFTGLVMLVVSFGLAFGVGHLFGFSAEGTLMMIAGPLVVLCDAVYRWKHPYAHWFHPSRGGSLFFLPLWPFGLLWLVFGIVDTVQGR